MGDRDFPRGRPSFSNKRGENKSNGDERPGTSFDRFSARGRGAGRIKTQSRGGRRGVKEKRKERPEFFDQIETRPRNLDSKTGANNQIVHLKANFFKVSTSKQFCVTQYRVDFPRDVANPGVKRYLIQQHQSSFGSFLFDGSNVLFLLVPLPNERTEIPSMTRDGQNCRLTIRKTRSIDFTDSNYLQILNLVQRDAMRALNLQLIGRDFYDAEAKIDIPQYRVQLWPGFVTSIRQHENDILLTCRLSHKVIRQESVLQIIADCAREGGDYQSRAKLKVIGTVVLTDYNNATYKVDDIDWNQNPDSTFSYEDREESFASYYQRKYQLTIRDRRQPLLVVKPTVKNIRGGKSKPIILIPELCRATGLTDQMKNDHKAMQDIARPARYEPGQYIERLRNLNSRLQENVQARKIFRQNQMELDHKLVDLEGQQLSPELITLSQDVKPENEDWSRDLQNHQMFRPVDIKNWFIVYPREVESLLDNFQRKFEHIAENLGIKVEKAQLMRTEDSFKPSYVKVLQRTMCQDPSLILVFVTSKNTDLYKAIKYTTLCPENATPVPVQVVVKKTLERQNETLMSIITKIAIQIDCKLGGIPWSVDLKLGGLMIIGFDVSHDPKTKRKSFGAMVASLNPTSREHGGHFYSTVDQHENGEQLSFNFGNNIIKALRKYHELNNSLPARILIYRDGVGDGNIEFVFKQELEDIKSKIHKMYKISCENGEERELKLGFVVVNKRTNARFMLSKRSSGENYTNPKPGTVVSTTVTMPERYDFYMVSQNAKDGTVRPAYYNVLEDGFYSNRPDVIHSITYKLCHSYFNYSGTIRIPSVVQYAKKLAILVSQFTNEAPSLNIPIKNQLYFL